MTDSHHWRVQLRSPPAACTRLLFFARRPGQNGQRARETDLYRGPFSGALASLNPCPAICSRPCGDIWGLTYANIQYTMRTVWRRPGKRVIPVSSLVGMSWGKGVLKRAGPRQPSAPSPANAWARYATTGNLYPAVGRLGTDIMGERGAQATNLNVEYGCCRLGACSGRDRRQPGHGLGLQ